jgi:hypothetical protein
MDRSSGINPPLSPVRHRGVNLLGRYFPTHADYAHRSGLRLSLGARGHRKGKIPRPVNAEAASFPIRYWAPERLGWWIAVLFMIGSFCFALAAWAASFPAAVPALLTSAVIQNGVFFAGSLFFTSAATCQLIESRQALRRKTVRLPASEITMALPGRFAWLGYYSSAAQWIGTLLFNINTFDALVAGGGWLRQDLAVWTPDFLGSICFLVASHFAYLEIRHETPEASLSRRIVFINYLGSAAFMLSALCAVAIPFAEPALIVWSASIFTLIGAVCFFVAAYLLIPELSEA